MKPLGLGVMVAGLFSAPLMADDVPAISARAAHFTESLGVPDGSINRAATVRIPGVRNLKSVLPGALYRSGGPGGQREMSANTLRGLCEAGFSKAIYLYPNGFTGTKTVNCQTDQGSNQLVYTQKGYLTEREKQSILGDVRDVIVDPSLGPVLVHCWNGYHASGEIAAVALRQFCPSDWNASEAQNYWMANQTGARLISRIGRFTPTDELNLSPATQTAICPRP